MLSNIKQHREKGFTIVELLIVIVIIAILATITIVAYNGITNRAKSTKAQSTASNIIKKLEAYNADVGNYPATYSLLSGATSDKSYAVASGAATFVATTALSAPADEKSINFATCVTPAGVRVSYWKYDGTAAIQHLYAGGATSASTCTNTAT
jgi:prepilin-type N-terminal cleavage/methylation domain-containing protein